MDERIYKELVAVAFQARRDIGNDDLAAGVVQAYAVMRAASLSQDGYWPEPAFVGVLGE